MTGTTGIDLRPWGLYRIAKHRAGLISIYHRTFEQIRSLSGCIKVRGGFAVTEVAGNDRRKGDLYPV